MKPRRSSVTSPAIKAAAPAAWASVLALVAVACGGAVEGVGTGNGSSSGGSSSSSSGESGGTTPTVPGTSGTGTTGSGQGSCYTDVPCGTKYIQLPDGGHEPVGDGGVPEGGTVQTCFCGNG
jgi:hypothetical protein